MKRQGVERMNSVASHMRIVEEPGRIEQNRMERNGMERKDSASVKRIYIVKKEKRKKKIRIGFE